MLCPLQVKTVLSHYRCCCMWLAYPTWLWWEHACTHCSNINERGLVIIRLEGLAVPLLRAQPSRRTGLYVAVPTNQCSQPSMSYAACLTSGQHSSCWCQHRLLANAPGKTLQIAVAAYKHPCLPNATKARAAVCNAVSAVFNGPWAACSSTGGRKHSE